MGYITFFLLLLISTLRLAAQESGTSSILAGFGLDAAFGLESSDLPVYVGSPECGRFTTGRSLLLGGSGRLVLPSFLADQLGADLRIRGTYSSRRLSTPPVIPTPFHDSEVGAVVTLDREFRIDSKAFSLGIDLLARYDSGPLGIALGASLGYRLSASHEQTDNVLGPGDYRFPDGQPSHPMMNGPALVSSPFSFGPMLVLSYAVPLGPRRMIAPELTVRYDLLAPVQNAVWQSMQFGIGGALLFDLTPDPAPPVVEVPPVPPAPPLLTASIDVFAIDSSGERVDVPTIHVREFLFRQHAPLLPAIFFERDSGVFAERYVRLGPSEVDSFRLTRLSGKGVLEMQRQTLNILGERMRGDPALRLTLFGSTSSQERPELGGERVASVRRYLHEVWGIDPLRMVEGEGGGPLQRSTEATEDGRADNRRVEFFTDHGSLLDPVVTEQVEQSFDPPMLQLNPEFRAEAGVRRWTIIVRQGGRDLIRYTDSDRRAGREPEIIWDVVREELGSVLDPVEGELVVEDSTGSTVVVRTQVPLLLERRRQVVDSRIELHGDRERIAYSLVGFDFESADIKEEQEPAVRSIAAGIRPGAVVTITGYTDRIGNERRNLALSAQRADRVASRLRSWLQALGISNVTIATQGGGIETQRFGNDLPEGRMLSRGVGIVIEQSLGAVEP